MENDKKEERVEYPFYFREGENLQIIATDFENGIFIAISHTGANKLGTTALSLPVDTSLGLSKERRHSDAPTGRRGLTSATVIGSRNEIYTQALAEKVALATAKIVYLSTNFKEQSESLFTEAITLVDDLLKQFFDTE